MSSQALKEFISDFGVPNRITCDGASEQVGKKNRVHGTSMKASHQFVPI